MATQLLIHTAIALFLGSLLASFLLVPVVQWFARRVGAVDRGGYRKVFEGAMPLLGGLAVAIPLLALGLGTALAGYTIFEGGQWAWLLRNYPEYFDPALDLASHRIQCLILTAGGVGILALGLVDDTRGMRARYKLAGQVAVALFVSTFGFSVSTVSLPLIGTIEFGMPLGVLLTAFWIVGLINAFNLIDGVDGLASGIAFMGAASLVVLSVIQGNVFVTYAGAALAGGLLAFLYYNFPPARIFLGDTGSMFLGYVLAALSLAGALKTEAAVILIAPVLALSFPIFETLVSIIRRYLRGVPIFMGDNHHTHHRLLSKGYSQPRVVLTLYSVAFFLAASAIMAAAAPEGSPWIAGSYALFCGTLVYIAWLAGYLRPTTFRRIAERRRRNRVLHSLSAYAALSLNGSGHAVDCDLLLALCRHELGLVHLELQRERGVSLMASTCEKHPGAAHAPKERLRVKSSDDENLFVLFEYETAPDDNRRNDVNACLATIFDQLMLDRALRATGIPLHAGEAPVLESEAKRG